MPAPAATILLGAEATRSGEWHDGIERHLERMRAERREELHELLAPYLEAVAALNPGGDAREPIRARR